jgi:preprotein translocase subunit SecF
VRMIDKIVKVIGSCVIACVLVSIPMLCLYSYEHDWDIFFKVILTFGVCFECLSSAFNVFCIAEKEA